VHENASPVRVYGALDTRIDTLFIGCLLALAPLGQLRTLAVRFLGLPVVVLAIALLTAVWTSSLLYVIGLSVLGVCTAWIILAVTGNANFVFKQFLRWSPLVYFGQISYGFYLWHYPISVVTTNYFRYQYLANLKTLAVTAILSLLIASASYHLLEMPALRLSRKFQ
jgi:peptidoglycan/LPS O-acetylase OafA/YrhL